MTGFKGGLDRPHKKVLIAVPRLTDEEKVLVSQIRWVKARLGTLGAVEFVRETEKRQGLAEGQLDLLLKVVTIEDSNARNNKETGR